MSEWCHAVSTTEAIFTVVDKQFHMGGARRTIRQEVKAIIRSLLDVDGGAGCGGCCAGAARSVALLPAWGVQLRIDTTPNPVILPPGGLFVWSGFSTHHIRPSPQSSIL